MCWKVFSLMETARRFPEDSWVFLSFTLYSPLRSYMYLNIFECFQDVSSFFWYARDFLETFKIQFRRFLRYFPEDFLDFLDTFWIFSGDFLVILTKIFRCFRNGRFESAQWSREYSENSYFALNDSHFCFIITCPNSTALSSFFTWRSCLC
jgi:hypothetical protein